MEEPDRYEPTLGSVGPPNGLEPTLDGAGRTIQGASLVHLLRQAIGRRVVQVTYGDPLYEGSETQWDDFVPRFHFPDWCEFAFDDGRSFGLFCDFDAEGFGMASYGFVPADKALAAEPFDGLVTITPMASDPGWARRLPGQIREIEIYLGSYWYRTGATAQDTSTARSYGMRDLVLTFENDTRVYFTLSKSFRGLSVQVHDHDRLAIVFDAEVARKAQVGPFNPHGKLLD